MATASGDPDALRTYATDTADAVAELQTQARQLAQLLDEFNATDKEVGARVANHGHELAALGERMAELDAFVGQVGDAFAAADQGPMFAPPAPGARRVTLDENRLARQVPIGDLAGAASRVESRVAAGIHAGRATVHGTRWVHARSRLYYLHREYYRPDTFWPDPDSYRRAEQQRRAALQRRLHHTGRHATSARQALQSSRPVTRIGRWIESATTGPGRWLRHGSRTLGGLSATYSLVEAPIRAASGDRLGAAASAAMAAGGFMMLFPPVAMTGAALVAVGLAIEERDRIVAAARWITRKLQRP
jgi:hypothetical protein